MMQANLMSKCSRSGNITSPSPVRLSDFASRNAEALSSRPRKISQNPNTSRKPSVPSIREDSVSSQPNSQSSKKSTSSSQERQDLYLSPQSQNHKTAASTAAEESKDSSSPETFGSDLNDILRHPSFPSLDMTAFDGPRRSSHRMSITVSPLASRRNTKDDFSMLSFDGGLGLSALDDDNTARNTSLSAMDTTSSPSQPLRRAGPNSARVPTAGDSCLKHRRSSSATLFDRRKSSVFSMFGGGGSAGGSSSNPMNFEFTDENESKEAHDAAASNGVSAAMKRPRETKGPNAMLDPNSSVANGRSFWKDFARERNNENGVLDEKLGILSATTRKHSNSMPGNFTSMVNNTSQSWMPEDSASSHAQPMR